MKEFNLNEVQVNAILEMRLRSLRKLEELQLTKERDNLLDEQKELNFLLKNETKQKEIMSMEIKKIDGYF